MTESLRKTSEKTGLPPGSLIHVGDVLEAQSRISLIDYKKEHIDERQIHSIDEIAQYKGTDTVTWVIVEGLAEVQIVKKIGEMFGIHPLVLEDILHTHQRPKFEEYDDYLYIVLKCLVSEEESFCVNYEQISLLVLKGFVFMFKEKSDDLLEPVLQHIRNAQGRIRNEGADYLMYMMLDTIMDQNFILIDALDDSVISLEDEVYSDTNRNILYAIQKLKREVITVRRNISPIRELLAGLLRSDSALIQKKTRIYLKDVSDHAIHIIESIESYRDILSGLMEIYMSNVSNKMNEVMKVLTVFASIFIPLTFLTGVYGMNFSYMPELNWKWAYPILWIAFVVITVASLLYFKRKRWL